MARTRMVTRTVKGVVADVLCMDTTTARAVFRTFTIGGTFANEKDLLKALQKVYDTDELMLVKISTQAETEQLYGMPEDMFIRLAEKLPPRATVEDDNNE